MSLLGPCQVMRRLLKINKQMVRKTNKQLAMDNWQCLYFGDPENCQLSQSRGALVYCFLPIVNCLLPIELPLPGI